MIESINLCINCKNKIHRNVIKFKKGYNVIIGPNGSGKTSLLKSINNCNFCKIKKENTDIIRYISTEELNPLFSKKFNNFENMIEGIRSLFKSNGQIIQSYLASRHHTNETVILLDSPETGQDYNNKNIIFNGLLKMSKKYQVIVATNCLTFIQRGNILDLGNKTLQKLLKNNKTVLNNFINEKIIL